MNTTSKLIAIAVIGVLILAGLPTLQSEKTEEHYEVTRYNMQGLTYDKEIIKVSKVDAEEIQKVFEGIDSSLAKDKIERKRDVLVEYGLIEGVRDYGLFNPIRESLLKIRKWEVPLENNYESHIHFLIGLNGFVGPGVNIGVNLLFMAPLLMGQFQGANLRLNAGDLVNISIITDDIISLSLISWFGLLLIIPFVTPFGYFDGFAIIGGYDIEEDNPI